MMSKLCIRVVVITLSYISLSLSSAVDVSMPPSSFTRSKSSLEIAALNVKELCGVAWQNPKISLALATGALAVGVWYKGSDTALFSRALYDPAWGRAYRDQISEAMKAVDRALERATAINNDILRTARSATTVTQQVDKFQLPGQTMTQVGKPAISPSVWDTALSTQLAKGKFNTAQYTLAELSEPYTITLVLREKAAAYGIGINTVNPLDAYLSYAGRKAAGIFTRSAAAVRESGYITPQVLSSMEQAFEVFVQEATQVKNKLKGYKLAVEWGLCLRRAALGIDTEPRDDREMSTEELTRAEDVSGVF